jgi:hypothetical protein
MITITRSFDHAASSVHVRQAPGGTLTPSRATQRRKKSASPEYLFVLGVCFAAFFAVLILERFLPPRWRSLSAQFGANSLFGDAKAAAHRYTGIAFQG